MTSAKAPLKVFCAGAARSALGDLPQSFEAEFGQPVDFTLGPVGSLVEKLQQGEIADVVVLSAAALGKLVRSGAVKPGSVDEIGSVGFAIAQKRGAHPLQVETADKLRQALLDAISFAFGDPAKGDTSGVHMANVIEQLGITREINAKAVLEPMGLKVAEAVAQGRAEIGALQTSLILARDDLQLAGVLPVEYQLVSTYAIGCVTNAPPGAQAFVEYLRSPAARAQFRKAGFESSGNP